VLLELPQGFANGRPILCIGAHCDDIEIGCAGTLVRLLRDHAKTKIVWAVFSGDLVRRSETRSAAGALLTPSPQLVFFEFRESFFPSSFDLIKSALEELKARLDPCMVFTHCLQDRHQDHSVLAQLTWNTFRSHLILEYEIPKYEGDLGCPNLFAPLSVEDLSRKVGVLTECFPSQQARAWFTAETFRALARLRGIECASPTGFAEAFHARKVCI
jgi:LmbE family N-acetylglucosaminyl deacetylase